MASPTIVEREPFTVVGLQAHFSGDESVIAALWRTFGDRWDEFDDLADADEAYGVVTDFEPEPISFDYVVGVSTATADVRPADLVAVDVPGGTYVRFASTMDAFEADYAAIETWLADSGYERRHTAEYERYGPEFDREDGATSYEYFLPVRPAAD